MAVVSAMGGMTDLLIKVVDSALVNFDDAKADLETAIDRQVTTLRSAGRPAEALVAFSPALTHYNPGDANLAMEVAATAEAAGQPRAQAELLRHVLRLQPGHAAAAAALGALEGGAGSRLSPPPPPHIICFVCECADAKYVCECAADLPTITTPCIIVLVSSVSNAMIAL